MNILFHIEPTVKLLNLLLFLLCSSEFQQKSEAMDLFVHSSGKAACTAFCMMLA